MFTSYVVLSALGLGLLASTALVAPTAQAQQAQSAQTPAGKMEAAHARPPRLTKEQRETMRTAIEQRDYNAWKEVLGDRPITKKITEDTFATFCDALDKLRNGDKEGAKQLFDQLGLKKPRPHGHQQKHHPLPR